MTKKTGVFDVSFDINDLFNSNETITKQKELIEKRKIDRSIQTISQQMKVSNYRSRTIKDYETIVNQFKKSQKITYLSDINIDTIYNWLESMKVSNQTKLTRR